MQAAMTGDWLGQRGSPANLFTFTRAGNTLTLGPFAGMVSGSYIVSDADLAVDLAGRCPASSVCILVLNPASVRADKVDVHEFPAPAGAGLQIGQVTTNAAGNVSSAARYDTRTARLPAGEALEEMVNGLLATAGGTMTGALTLAADPAADLQPATKQYIDNLFVA